MDFRAIILERMEQRGVTQTELQHLTGIPQPRISDFLRRKRDVTTETLRKMMESLELEVRPARKPRRKGQ